MNADDRFPLFPEIDRYIRIRRIGQGSAGVVYEAHDRDCNRLVALKVLCGRLDSAALQAWFAARVCCTTPNFVKLHDLDYWNGHWFFTMERIDGVDLYEYLRPNRPTVDGASSATNTAYPRPGSPVSTFNSVSTWTGMRKVWPRITDAVEALHAQGPVHGNLKFSNILVARDGRVLRCASTVLRPSGQWRPIGLP